MNNKVIQGPTITTNTPIRTTNSQENNDFFTRDEDKANQAWNLHLSINNSIIVELFQGQLKSTVTCLTCNKESVSFDTFMFLTLPIPRENSDIYVIIYLIEFFILFCIHLNI